MPSVYAFLTCALNSLQLSIDRQIVAFMCWCNHEHLLIVGSRPWFVLPAEIEFKKISQAYQLIINGACTVLIFHVFCISRTVSLIYMNPCNVAWLKCTWGVKNSSVRSKSCWLRRCCMFLVRTNNWMHTCSHILWLPAQPVGVISHFIYTHLVGWDLLVLCWTCPSYGVEECACILLWQTFLRYICMSVHTADKQQTAIGFQNLHMWSTVSTWKSVLEM